MAKLKLGVKTVYFPFLVVCGILIGTLVLSGMQNGVMRDVCSAEGKPRENIILIQQTSSETPTAAFNREIEDRKQHVNQLCVAHENVSYYRDVREHLLYNVESNIVFCYVPKVASTLWKTVFHLIDRQAGQVELGDEIVHAKKGYIHTVRLPWLAHIRPFAMVFNFLHSATRVMFTRDPYSRLFSAYVDKLMLPSFWKPVGMTIVKSLRHNPDATSLQCGHDVTFEEFLRHVVDITSEPELIKYGIDDHWIPVSWICQPCQMNYDFIGKIETFTEDRDTVLAEVMDLTDTVQYLHSNQVGSENSLNQAINTSWFAVVNFKKCVSKVDIMAKLWQSFQIQGYLPVSLPLPLEILTHSGTITDTKEAFRKYVLETYAEHGLSREEASKQRRLAMAKAYQSIDPQVKRDIVKTFKQDFELFSYDQHPVDLYEYNFKEWMPK
ncbi:carbohydrate sulfotransferase 11-like [Liolophura sinensis]|uniref:carbohydrate sulfotransferase 11-like n=1 Tax=Liolophura sinensis TaxID=3198878 RepID=UPI00315848BC